MTMYSDTTEPIQMEDQDIVKVGESVYLVSIGGREGGTEATMRCKICKSYI